MKFFVKLCLCFGLFLCTTPSFAQLVPDPNGIDYCDCLEGVQDETVECPPCNTGGNTNTNNTNNNNNNNNTEFPTEEGDGSEGGGIPSGRFPLVISWLECFFDPDC